MADGTVILRRSSLGDVVLLGSVTAAVPGPVTVVTAPAWRGVAERLIGVERVVSWGEPLPPGRVVDLQGSLASLSRCLRAGRPFRRIHKHSVRRRLRLRVDIGPSRPPVPELYARACGVQPTPGPWIRTPGGRRDTLALVPGAAWATKRWAADRFAAVGSAWPGRVVVLGGPGEQALCDAVAGPCDGEVVCEEGFDRTIAELGRTAVAVAGDTGLAHLAGACGASVVALFGPTHPDDGFAVHPGDVVQRTDLGCRPCTLHRQPSCPLGHHACMNLAVADVIEAIRRLPGYEGGGGGSR